MKTVAIAGGHPRIALCRVNTNANAADSLSDRTLKNGLRVISAPDLESNSFNSGLVSRRLERRSEST
jgi:hypothetical protein